MSVANFPVNLFEHYHAHLYYDQQSWPMAEDLLRYIEQEMRYKVGRRHHKLVGPHPMWSCQISFNKGSFDQLIDWLGSNRQGLSVLVHPVTDNDLKDHTELASWLGEPLNLNLGLFR